MIYYLTLVLENKCEPKEREDEEKALTAMLSVCVAMAMTACGKNAGTTEVGETVAAEESVEADTQAEAEADCRQYQSY